MHSDTPTLPRSFLRVPIREGRSLSRALVKDCGLRGHTPEGHRLFDVEALVKKARTILNGMELDGLIETQDGDTYRITEKGKAQAALHNYGRV